MFGLVLHAVEPAKLGRGIGKESFQAFALRRPHVAARDFFRSFGIALLDGFDQPRMLGCREGTVKSRIHRGRERLRALLTPYRAGLPEVETT